MPHDFGPGNHLSVYDADETELFVVKTGRISVLLISDPKADPELLHSLNKDSAMIVVPEVGLFVKNSFE